MITRLDFELPSHSSASAATPPRFTQLRAGLLAIALSSFISVSLLGQNPPPPASQPAAPVAAAPAPANPTSVSAPAGYVLSPNDQVSVEVFGEEDLRMNGRLNAEGNLSLALLGSVRLAGLTLTQAAARLTELYG